MTLLRKHHLYIIVFCIVTCATLVQLHPVNISEHNVLEYLNRFGYIEDNENSLLSQDSKKTTLRNGLILFQEYFNLTRDGTLNNETISMIKASRCGVKDVPKQLSTTRNQRKWNKTNLTWHVFKSTPQITKTTTKAFQLWESTGILKFSHSYVNPNILISFSSRQHNFIEMYNGKRKCEWDLDCEGNVLGHAFYPNSDGSSKVVEIHIDECENWYLGMQYPPPSPDSLSLLYTLAHEIGHTLGLEHIFSNFSSIIFPTIKHSGEMSLSTQDVDALRYLYGNPSYVNMNSSINTTEIITTTPLTTTKITTTPLTTTKITTTVTTTTSTHESQQIANINHPPHLCDHFTDMDHFLIINQNLYAIWNQWVWIISLENLSYGNPLHLRHWLRFLQNDFRKISAIYQRGGTGDIILIDNNNLMYMFAYPTLHLQQGWPKPVSQTSLSIADSKITAIINTYMGKTYIFYEADKFGLLNECTFSVNTYGLIHRQFRGLPSSINSAFRYTNGLLYFFNNNYYYEYSEFQDRVLRSGKFDLSLFGITCPNKNLIDELYLLLNKLYNFRNSFS